MLSLIKAKTNQEQLLGGLQMSPSYSNFTHKSHDIISWDDKGKVNYGFLLLGRPDHHRPEP